MQIRLEMKDGGLSVAKGQIRGICLMDRAKHEPARAERERRAIAHLEGAEANAHGALPGGGLSFVPRDDAHSKRLLIPPRDGLAQTDEQHPTADAVNVVPLLHASFHPLLSIGTVRSRPSLSRSSKRMSC